jgi:hypothetical protein
MGQGGFFNLFDFTIKVALKGEACIPIFWSIGTSDK